MAASPFNTTPLSKSFLDVDGVRMAYHESGQGEPVVFLHGNPTSSYLWRNVVPHVAPVARVIAPDLVGMGDSGKLSDIAPDSYRFVEHRRYLDGLLDRLDLGERVTLVVHDWGSALGFDWANRHRDRVAGIAYMEAIVRPLTWDEWPDAARRVFQGFRSDAGEDTVIGRNTFVERVLPGSVLRELSAEEMVHYRRPFIEPLHRRPTLTWPREIPIDGEPADVVAIVSDYAAWLAEAPVAKLFVNADPGGILVGAQRDFCRTWPNQTEVTVRGIHFCQEDSPDELGRAIVDWLARR
ncbi:MAG: haloalkane dehalogenase [Acidimicrobiia bacterium]|nr:haloalkane dehalogenase [Acidimicrobiia bacterium]